MTGKVFKFLSGYKNIFIAAALLVFSLYLTSLNETVTAAGVRVFALGITATISEAFNNLKDFFVSDAEIESLRKQNAYLMLEVNKLRSDAANASSLKDMLGIMDSTRTELIPAIVIFKNISKAHWIFIINKGREAGIVKGMPVMSERGLVGIVRESGIGFATVKTIKDISLKLAVFNQRSKVNGILNYTGNRLVIKNIPSTYDMEVGDRIVSSDFSSILPPDIPVGLVVRKETNVTGLVSDIIVSTFSDLNSLKYVYVYKSVFSKKLDGVELNLIGGD